MDTYKKPYKAADPCDLERMVMDSTIAKNEAMWWARDEIEHLREKLRVAEEALVVSEQFVDRHSEEWYLSGQRDLTQIREALAKIREVK